MSNKHTGLTLVELMVTLAVAIILLAVGVPLYTGMAANNRAVTQANTFLTAFKLARSEAVKRSTEVSVCAVDDPTAGTLGCSADTADWANGMLVFTDGGTTGAVDGGDVLIKAFPITAAGGTASTSGTFVRFAAGGDVADMTANGACSTSGTCFQLGQGEASGNQTRCIHVMRSGQIRLERAACS